MTLDNFTAVVSEMTPEGVALPSALQLAVIAIATTILGIVLATTAGYAFSRFSFPGQPGLMAFWSADVPR